ncbi:hypothetical protein EMPS_06752 [Entomortierella parvispora]|nr:hypothetical protein EMPS_06752 [Entomortierella parvispora]
MLPTLTVMQARHPDMYADALCCLCRAAPEDNDHVWTCPNSYNQQQLIWADAVASIPKWGRAAIRKANEDADTRHRKQQARTPNVAAPKRLQWYQPSDTLLWASLYSAFHDLSAFRPPEQGQLKAPLASACSVVTAYQGLLHSALIEAWRPIIKGPRSVVVAVAHQFIRRLDRDALARLWKTRCEVTIAWEKTQGIRPKMKKQAQTGQPWNNASGTILPPDTCQCGKPNTDHHQGLCPGAQDNPTLADQRLLACVRGQVHLSTLEKMGKIHFL